MKIFKIEDLNKQNKNLMTLLHKRYGQYRSLAYMCLLESPKHRIKMIYEWLKTGKLKLDHFEMFCEDFIFNKFQAFPQDDIESIIKFVKKL